MLAEHMRKLFGYNTWAWQRVFASVEQLGQQDYLAPRPIFGGSIHGVMVHTMSAEQIWYRRCQGESPKTLADPADYADFAALFADWRQVIHQWANYVQWLSAEQCEQKISYQNTHGETNTLSLGDILQHVINHSSEHRSQVTPILYQLDYPTQPLDYMLYRLRR